MRISYFFVFLPLFLGGCATYQNKVGDARKQLSAGHPQAAVDILATPAGEDGKDQVLYMLDYGVALHEAGDFKKSNEILIAADRLAEVKDYTSLSREAGSLLLNEGLIQYKTERFENILINVYLALNFTLLGNFEDALVECRRIDQKIYKFKLENEDSKKSFFARYLSAMIWEAQNNWDSAYIDYKNAYEINSTLEQIGKDLMRSAWRARRYEELARWEKKFPQFKLSAIKKEFKNDGELVFLYQQGWIPRKRPRPENFRFPYLVPQSSQFHRSKLIVDKKESQETKLFYDIGKEAIRTLNDDYGYLVAKKVAGFVAKEIVADQIRQKNEALGALALIAMHVSDQADLRQWSTLPESFQIARLSLSPGDHQLSVVASGPSGEKTIFDDKIHIKKGKKTFVSERTY